MRGVLPMKCHDTLRDSIVYILIEPRALSSHTHIVSYTNTAPHAPTKIE